MKRFTFKLMTAAACLGMVAGEALAQERERSDRHERAERDNDRERPRGERSRGGERRERGSSNRTERQRRPQSGGFSGSGGFGGRPGGAGGFGGPGGPPSRPASFLRMFPVMAALDADGNGEISAEEIKAAPAALKKLDKNKDGKLTEAELRPTFPGFGGSRSGSARGGRGGFEGRGGAPQGRPSFEGDDRPQSPRVGGERSDHNERSDREEPDEERRRRPSRPRE